MSNIFNTEPAISVRHKSALLTLFSLAIIFAFYFARVATGVSPAATMGLLIEVVIALVVVQIVGHALIAGTASDRYTRMDERERSIDRRATAVGYHLLIGSALCAAVTGYFGFGTADMANAILLAIVICECVRQTAFLFLHHRAV